MLHFKEGRMDIVICSVLANSNFLLIIFPFCEFSSQVSSDLSMVGGAPILTVEPDDTVAYTLSVSPWRRGIFQGTM